MKIIIIITIIITLFLTSCTSRYTKTPSVITNNNQLLYKNNIVPMPPKLQSIDWYLSLLPLVNQILSIPEINDNSVLLIHAIKNNTNGNLQTSKATTILKKLIASTSKFIIIEDNEINRVRKNFGLSLDDTLEDCSKAITCARYLKAQYLLYSRIIGDIKQPYLDIKLLVSQNGEIIWSSKYTIHSIT